MHRDHSMEYVHTTYSMERLHIYVLIYVYYVFEAFQNTINMYFKKNAFLS